jgi:hypothetical protein
MEPVFTFTPLYSEEKSPLFSEKPFFDYNKNENYIIVKYSDREFLMDINDHIKIINAKNFLIRIVGDIYPSFCENNKKINYLQYLFHFIDGNEGNYYFINGNNKDLRRKNVEFRHIFDKHIREKYGEENIIEYNHGHYKSSGQNANITKNPFWKVKENQKEIILLYCGKNAICQLCPISYQKILDFEKNIDKKLYWHIMNTGYIVSNIDKNIGSLLIHQVITGHYRHGRGTGGNNNPIQSVDHIDRNPLNNTWENLRIATRKEQEQNSKGIMPNTKRNRQYSACKLPEGITQEMLPKYVVYYKEQNPDREYFRVEGHPLLEKDWISSKSKNFTINEKLKQAIEKISELNNGINNEKPKRELPKNVMFAELHNKLCLVYDERVENNRFSLSRVLQPNFDLQKELVLFNIDIHQKYPDKQLEGIALGFDNPNETIIDPDVEIKQKFKFIKYLKITEDRGTKYLTYDERTKIDDKKIIFNLKLRLKCGYNINEKLKELKSQLYDKYHDKFPEKLFIIPDEI